MHYLLILMPVTDTEGSHLVQHEFEWPEIDHLRAIKFSEKISADEPFDLSDGTPCLMKPMKLIFWITDEDEQKLVKRW